MGRANPVLGSPCRLSEWTYNPLRLVLDRVIVGGVEASRRSGVRPDCFHLVPITMSSFSPLRPTSSGRPVHSTNLAQSIMDNDIDLRDFDNMARLFPLPGLVMFPHVVLPLHIFEPRYRQMTEDALAGDRLITMIQISPLPSGKSWIEPVKIEEVGCLGRIIQHERLPDGRFNILLLGRKRVRISRELTSDKLYRTAEVELLEDSVPLTPEEPARDELVELFRKIFERHHKLDPDLA